MPTRTTTTSSNGSSLRGGRSEETSIQVDGVKIDDAFAGGYGSTSASTYPTVSTLAVQEVQVTSSSAYSAEYGDVQSGVVNTSTDALARKDEKKVPPEAKPNPITAQPLNNTNSTTPQDAVGGEQYDAIYENAFMTANINRTSTFSIDVDRASYSNSRRFITSGQRPPRDAVRIEEFINYFSYDYPEPVDEHPFSIFTEVSDCPWERTHRLVMVGVQGKRVEATKLPPANLVFLIDVSGSMSDPNKLPLVKKGLNLLVDQLRDEDNVAMTVYAGAAGLVLEPTSGAKKKEIREAIDRLSAGGSTAGGAGIKLAYAVAKQNFRKNGNNRVILMTDGDFNVGTSSDEELVRLIEEKRNDGIFLTVLGFGTGNYKDSKMEKLADNGNGNYAYIDNLAEAKKTLVEEMGSTLLAIAKDVKIQIEFNPEAVSSYRLIGYENRMLRKEDFEDDRKDAGELGAGHTVTALYEVVPVGAEAGTRAGGDTLDIPWMKETGELMEVRLRYKQPDDSVSKLIEQPVQDRNVRLDKASENLRWAAAVAEFGLLLRQSQHRASASFEDVLRLANGAKGNDASGYRAEFIALVEQCKGLPMAAR
jgi:Ca-activated chloride channel family protein